MKTTLQTTNKTIEKHYLRESGSNKGMTCAVIAIHEIPEDGGELIGPGISIQWSEELINKAEVMGTDTIHYLYEVIPKELRPAPIYHRTGKLHYPGELPHTFDIKITMTDQDDETHVMWLCHATVQQQWMNLDSRSIQDIPFQFSYIEREEKNGV